MLIFDISLLAGELLCAIVLFWLGGYAEKTKNSKWRIGYAVPMLLAFIITGIYGFEICMMGVYLGAFLLLAGFWWESKKVRKCAGILAFIAILSAIPVCLLDDAYRCPDYVKDFEDGFRTMKEHYVLAEYKEIDWDALYDSYLPVFQDVNKRHDAVGNIVAWNRFCQEFQDGHVSFCAPKESNNEEAARLCLGNDYGLSMMTLSDGRTVAVNVEPGSKAQEAGIHNGTEILLWDDKTIEDVLSGGRQEGALNPEIHKGESQKSEITYTTIRVNPNKDNEIFYQALYAAGMGGETVAVTYRKDDGTEDRVELSKIGSYYQRLKDTMEIIDQGVATGDMTWKAVADDTYVLRIKAMLFDTDSAEKRDYGKMKTELKEKVLELKEQGIKNLIIDMRGNMGGSGDMVKALAEIFAPEGRASITMFRMLYGMKRRKAIKRIRKQADMRLESHIPFREKISGIPVRSWYWSMRKVSVLPTILPR